MKAQKFYDKVVWIMNGQEAKEGDSMYRWSVETLFGRLLITVHESDIKPRQTIFSIFMRFDDPEKAKTCVNCNPFSGKWNIHSTSPDDAICQLEQRLDLVQLAG